jgi:hypothetical protein
LIGFDRFRPIIEFLVAEPQPRPGIRIVRIDVQRRVEVLDRSFVLASRHQALAARLVRRAGKRVPVDGVIEVRDRLGVVPLSLINETAGVIGLCAFRVKSDRLVQVCTRLVELVLGSKEIPAAEVGCSVLRIDGDRLIEILHCKVVPSLLAIGESAVV